MVNEKNKVSGKVMIALIAVLVITYVALALKLGGTTSSGPGVGGHLISGDDSVKKFTSQAELESFLKTGQETATSSGGFYNMQGGVREFAAKADNRVMMTTMAAPAASTASGSSDYSQTNIQVAGVDEADTVKNDGKYIYLISGQKLVIVDAYPAEQGKLVSETEINGTPFEIFINKDKLVVFAHDYNYGNNGVETASDTTAQGKMMAPTGIMRPNYWPAGERTLISVYDVSDRENPKITREITVSGNYQDSRMIGKYVYAIVNQPVYYYGGGQPVPLPAIAENGISKKVLASDIYYFPYPDYNYNYVNILALNTQDDSQDYNSKTFLAGNAQNTYVSLDNIYMTYTKWNNLYTQDNVIEKVFIPALPADVGQKVSQIQDSNATPNDKMDKINEQMNVYLSSLSKEEQDSLQKDMVQRNAEFEKEMAKQREQTVVHKIAISNGQIDYKAQGSVPGHVLNQFSMDENDGYFRIATTTASSWGESGAPSENNLYVLDESLKTVGTLEDLAPGEKIYSARFMENRAYLVTFKTVDPLFVIDLSEPTAPKVLGKLKIPGYSDYLHPYDETHLIGIGKDVDESIDADKVHSEGAVYYTAIKGVKLSLFDVSDVEHPIEVAKYVIGDRGTESEALRDHKAFLFSKEKNLLVIPITLAEIDKAKYPNGTVPSYVSGDFTFQGAYVFNLDADNGFQLKGRVTHLDDNESLLKSGYYYSSPFDVHRSLYISNVLYTISDRTIKMNDLKTDGLDELNKVKLPYSDSMNVIYSSISTPVMVR